MELLAHVNTNRSTELMYGDKQHISMSIKKRIYTWLVQMGWCKQIGKN